MVNKKTFKPFRLEELTWGINVRDSASEIEDKQAVDIVNWNFKGNRLVNEKWIENTWNSTKSEIWGMKIDSWDIFTVSQWNVYKNWVVTEEGSAITISVDRDNFKSGVFLYFTLDSNSYKITWTDIEDFINNVDTAVWIDGYTTSKQDDVILISKSDWSDISYTVTENTAFVIYNWDNIFSDYYIGKDIIWIVEIDWIQYTWKYIYDDNTLNAGQVDIEIMEQINAVIPAQYESSVINLNTSTWEAEDDYFDHAGIILNNVTTMWRIREEYHYSELTHSGRRFPITGTLRWTLESIGDIWFHTWIGTIEGQAVKWASGYNLFRADPWDSWYNTTYDYTGTITFDWITVAVTYTGWVANFLTLWINQIDATAGYTWFRSDYWHISDQWGDNNFIFYKDDGGIINITNFEITRDVTVFRTEIDGEVYWPFRDYYNTSVNHPSYELATSAMMESINSVPLINASISSPLQKIRFSKDDGSEIIYDITSSYVDVTDGTYLWVDIANHTYENIFPNINFLPASSWLNGRANIVVWNLWVLTIDKDEGWAYYSYDWINVKIWEDSIGNPTVWTIYNWKIVLWGYEDNDNIIFSKTSSPTQPLSLLNFTDYSAGGQSVSGWDKWLVTGMMVWENWLYVFKDNSVWYTNSEVDNPSSFSFNFRFNKITSNWALSQNVITEVDQEIFYLDWKSREVRRLGYEQNLTTLRDVAISREMSDLFKLLPEEQPLATSHFSYPNYKLSLTDWQSPTVEYNNGNSYHTNNKHFIYNVENKSWTTRDGIDWLIVSDKWHFADRDGLVYKDFEGSTSSTWTYLSKEYVFDDDIQYKKFGRFEVIGNIKSSVWNVKQLKVVIIVDDEEIDERIIEANWNESIQIREKIDMYDIGQKIQFKLEHSWVWEVEVHDVQIYYKRTSIQPQDYN